MVIKKGILTAALVFAVLLVIGISGTVSSLKDKSEIEKGVDDFNYLSVGEFYDGKFVSGNVFEIYGEFAYTESYTETLGVKHSSKVTSHYYLVPVTGGFEASILKLIPVEIRTSENISNAELLMRQTFDFRDYGTEPDKWNEFTIFGKVSELDGEVEEYLYSWLTNDGTDGTKADYENMICPYIITESLPDAPEKLLRTHIILTAAGAVGLTAILFIFIKALRSTSPSEPANAPETDTSDPGVGTGDDENKQQ